MMKPDSNYNLRSIREAFKAQGIFYTPPELAELVKSYIPFKPAKVYDPTCGDGGLLAVFGDDVLKFGQEINAPQLDVARDRLINFTGYCGDTLKDDGFADEKFDCIVANPPFSVKWEPDENDRRFKDAPCVPTASKADYAFLLHILYHLSDDGVAAVIGFPGILYRGGREGKIRQWLIDNNHISKVVAIPGKTFVDTSIATVLLVLDKSGRHESVEFIDKEDGKCRVVSKAEIIRNDYNLSVNYYIEREVIKEQFDPVELEMSARKEQLKNLRAELELSRLCCGIEGLPLNPHLDDIIEIVESFRQ
ncbi:TPA: N-6 DNA methylase [Salmonella enterica]|uniref:site-specific DNA-methyltransferase (adenine-specific) n=1 Tax=Salmonella enterica TaxID=28901 RepID=A0A756I6N7_SALER|nr:N-6 DNA methylase [Salmonella enterica]